MVEILAKSRSFLLISVYLSRAGMCDMGVNGGGLGGFGGDIGGFGGPVRGIWGSVWSWVLDWYGVGRRVGLGRLDSSMVRMGGEQWQGGSVIGSGPFQSCAIDFHPLVLSLSKDALVVRQAHHERDVLVVRQAPARGGRTAP